MFQRYLPVLVRTRCSDHSWKHTQQLHIVWNPVNSRTDSQASPLPERKNKYNYIRIGLPVSSLWDFVSGEWESCLFLCCRGNSWIGASVRTQVCFQYVLKYSGSSSCRLSAANSRLLTFVCLSCFLLSECICLSSPSNVCLHLHELRLLTLFWIRQYFT